MSESEDDLDYVEILQTLNDKNLFLKNQEQNTELKKKFDESLTKYWELRNHSLNMKDEFEINQIQMYQSNHLLADSRNQYKTQITKVEEFKKKSESLQKTSLEQRVDFEKTVEHWNNKINELSTTLDEESQLINIQNGQTNIASLQKEIERIKQSHINEDKDGQTEKIDCNLKGLKEVTNDLLERKKDFEEKLKNCTELETEINEFGVIIEDVQKQLQGMII